MKIKPLNICIDCGIKLNKNNTDKYMKMIIEEEITGLYCKDCADNIKDLLFAKTQLKHYKN